MVLSFNKHTTSLASSTCTLIPRSRSQVILTSIYFAKKVTWFKDFSESGLLSPDPAPVTPLESVLYNQLHFFQALKSAVLSHLSAFYCSVWKVPCLFQLGLGEDFISFSQSFFPGLLFCIFPTYPGLLGVLPSIPLPHCAIPSCSFSVSYTNPGTLGQQLYFCLALPLYPFCLEPVCSWSSENICWINEWMIEWTIEWMNARIMLAFYENENKMIFTSLPRVTNSKITHNCKPWQGN